MHISILTIFPEIFAGFCSSSLIKKAVDGGILKISLVNIRDFADPPHFHVDDTPYGGGAGMVMKPEPIARAIEHTKRDLPDAKVILLSPAGALFSQAKAHALSKTKELILICGRYEGIDQRVIDLLIDEEISIGDYVLMGGEVPAMAIIEATVRLVDGVIGNPDSLSQESFIAFSTTQPLLEAPQYTRPPEFRNVKVPEVLLSGNHQKVADWRHEQALKRTGERRPDLCKKDK